MPQQARIALSLPTIHCQTCISAVERGLNAYPGVRAARVNLTLKRALVDAGPEVRAADLIAALARPRLRGARAGRRARCRPRRPTGRAATC